MELPYAKSIPQSGFNFDNYLRNKALIEKAGIAAPKMTSTGTTIVGCCFDGGVALATDTRATAGPIVGDKNCMKLHYLAPNIYTCGAGTAADCDHVNEMIKRDLELHRLQTGAQSRVNMAITKFSSHLFKYMGHVGCGLIIGGIDIKGP
jgi:20S proteasome subunit beta 2